MNEAEFKELYYSDQLDPLFNILSNFEIDVSSSGGCSCTEQIESRISCSISVSELRTCRWFKDRIRYEYTDNLIYHVLEHYFNVHYKGSHAED